MQCYWRSGLLNCFQACWAPSPAKISQNGVTSRLRTDDNQKARGHILDSSSIRECRTTFHGKPRKLILLHLCFKFKKSRFARKWYHDTIIVNNRGTKRPQHSGSGFTSLAGDCKHGRISRVRFIVVSVGNVHKQTNLT